MAYFQQYHVAHVLAPAAFLFFFVCALAGLAVGAGLLLARERTFRVFGVLNRWVPTRPSLRWLELPRDINRPLWAWRRTFAVAVIAGAAFSLAFLVGLESERIAQALVTEPAQASMVTAWLVDSMKWMLIIGNLFSLATGLALAFLPRAMLAFEATFDRWHSTRNIASYAERQLYPLDRAVEAWPRSAGALIVLASLVALYTTGSILIR